MRDKIETDGCMNLNREKILGLLFLLSALPTAVQAQLHYVTNNGTITITAYDCTNGSGGAVIIPITTNGLLVTDIGNTAFASRTCLTSITIPDSIASIGSDAFSYCTSLTNVTIGIGVTNIGNTAFRGCSSLTNVAIPSSVTRIGSGAFGYCTSLTAVTVNTNNPAYVSIAGVLFDKTQTMLIQYPGGKVGGYTVSSSVISILNDAFSGCTGLKNIVIPNSVISIGSFAFAQCGSLTNVIIPDSVKYLEGYAFYKCSSLASVTIGNGVTNIANSTFSFCTSLTSVTIPNSVTSIASGAFYLCSQLTNVTLPGSVANIGLLAFQNCYALTGIYFHGNAPSVISTAFAGDNATIIYYLPGTTGWSNTFAGRPTVLWNPQAQANDASFGVRTNRFGFNITGSSNLVIVVETCTNLTNPAWSPVSTNALTGGSSYFSDSQWTNHTTGFYRFRSP